ncbi:TRAP transporter small permease subunit [Hoeflea sp. WL0058]|uniref:TRAP transporter small permease protein n=1 Tax=Flavimaribacter sediminis TaxID=2865987 RepID=A0AAE3CZ85_9HYPH|nr:TRAP transporter small permease subunit [Flavimaribacter sediminis]MBW8635677.1 TRAP transporter small permease subunit [Flavimaribacter sediminis]
MMMRIEFTLAALLLSAIVCLVAIASITRYAGAPIIWSVEVAQTLFIWLCMLAADIALQQSRHFGLDWLGDILAPVFGRMVKIFNIAIVLVLLVFLFVYSIELVRLSHPRLYGATQMHFSFVTGALPFGLFLMIRTLGYELYRSLRKPVDTSSADGLAGQ